MSRQRLLAAYTDATQGRAPVWGRDDCSTWPAQWVAEVTGRVVEWPAYETEDQAWDLIAAGGGLVPLWRDVAGAAGLRERDVALEGPQCGDVGIILTRTLGDVGVIFGTMAGLGNGPWLVWLRADTGARPMSVRRSTILAAWEV